MIRYLVSILLLFYLVGCEDSTVQVEEFPIEEMNIIKYSFRFDEMTQDANNLASFYYSVQISQIDRDVFDGGLVTAHIRFDENDPWISLPYSFGIDDDNDSDVDYTYSIYYSYGIETLTIYIDFSAPGISFGATDKFYIKAVVIPPGSDWEDY